MWLALMFLLLLWISLLWLKVVLHWSAGFVSVQVLFDAIIAADFTTIDRVI